MGRPASKLRAVSSTSQWVAVRQQQAKFYETFLRATTNKQDRPYGERTIRNYTKSVEVLDKYLTSVETGALVGSWAGGGFEVLDPETVNAFYRHYYSEHTQGGTNTLQRNLAAFFHWMAAEFDVPDLLAETKAGAAINRYRPGPVDSTIIDDDLMDALLKVTSGKDFMAVRDHAIIRLFLSGMRAEQMARLRVEDLDLNRRIAHIAGLKGASDHPVPFGQKTSLALNRWLRLRATNVNVKDVNSGKLWLGTQNRGPMSNSGIYQMLRRRAAEAGYPKQAIHPHMFRHTRAHLHLEDGGSEGDLMQTMGWSSRAMVDRYAASTARERAIKDAHERGLDDRY